MHIHREGYRIIATTFAIAAVVVALAYLIIGNTTASHIIAAIGLLVFLIIVRFFRCPNRVATLGDNLVIAAADGKIVRVKKVKENEFIKGECIQVSTFMSIFNVHANYFPVGGTIVYSKYHDGKYLVAFHSKSSENNERTSIAVKCSNGDNVLFRQIAGYIARRVVYYAKEGEHANQCSELGFIKFGSRLDIFLPLDAKIMVKKGQTVKACRTVIAELPERNNA